MSLTIDGQANSIASSTGGVNIPATVGTLSVGPSGSYMNVTSSGTNIGPNGSYITANSSGIGIGTNNPQTALHLKTNGGAIALIESNTNYDGNIRVKNTGAYYTIGMLGSPGSTSLSFYDSNAEASRMSIDTSGRVTMPSQPSFRVYGPSGAVNTIITFNNAEYNIGNHMNAVTGIFTAPIAGRYLFTFAILCGSPLGSYVRINFCKNSTTVDTTLGDALWDGLSTYGSPSMAQIFSLAANDTIRLRIEGSGTYGTSYGSFSGCLMG